MSKIINISLAAMQKGIHPIWDNCILIQILDPKSQNLGTHPKHYPWAPNPKEKFTERYIFQFMDVDNNYEGITKLDAFALVTILKKALESNHNVIVHCTAGICRSGAVVEVAEMMGFDKCEAGRIPNTRVKRLMMEVLGWSYTDNTTA